MDDFYNVVKNETLGVGQYSYFNLSAGTAGRTTIKTGAGFLGGITVNSHSSGIFSITDGTTYSVTNLIHSSITLGAAERFIPFNGERFTNGLTINVSGTAFLTIQYK